MSKERVQVTIDGMEFYVVGSDDKAHVQNLASELNNRLQDTYRHNARLNDIQCHILTALNILDEKEKLKRQCEEIESSGGGENAGLYIKERDEAKEALMDSQETVEKKNEEVKELKGYVEELKEQVLALKEERDQAKEAGEQWEAEKQEHSQALDRLADKNYEAQMRIADLSKEISILREERQRSGQGEEDGKATSATPDAHTHEGDISKCPVHGMMAGFADGADLQEAQETIPGQMEFAEEEQPEGLRQDPHAPETQEHDEPKREHHVPETEEEVQDEMDEKINMIYHTNSSTSSDTNSNSML